MKNYILIGLLCLFAQAVKAESDIEAVLNGYFNAWNSHNKEEIKNFFAPNIIWYDLASGGTITGKDKVFPAITDYFMGYVADMYWYKSGDVYISENTIIYEWTYGGTFNGTWGDNKISDKVFSLKGISTTTINNQGKIIAQKDYYDMESFKRGIGLIP